MAIPTRAKTFEEAALFTGVAVAVDGKARAGMGVDLGDVDGDGLLDFVVTNHEFETTSVFRNLDGKLFADATAQTGIGRATLPFVGFGVVFFDYDNDSNLDLAIVNGHVVDNTALFRAGSTHAQPRLLFRNEGRSRLVDVSNAVGSGFRERKVGRTLVAGDIDNDGDLDVLVTNNGQSVDLLRNDGGNRNNAIVVRLVGTRSNRDGIGARLRVTTGKKTQLREVKAGSSYLGQNDLRVHVGVGTATVIDRLEIFWPSGRMETIERLPANAIVTVVEGEGVTKSTPFHKAK